MFLESSVCWAREIGKESIVSAEDLATIDNRRRSDRQTSNRSAFEMSASQHANPRRSTGEILDDRGTSAEEILDT